MYNRLMGAENTTDWLVQENKTVFCNELGIQYTVHLICIVLYYCLIDAEIHNWLSGAEEYNWLIVS